MGSPRPAPSRGAGARAWGWDPLLSWGVAPPSSLQGEGWGKRNRPQCRPRRRFRRCSRCHLTARPPPSSSAAVSPRLYGDRIRPLAPPTRSLWSPRPFAAVSARRRVTCAPGGYRHPCPPERARLPQTLIRVDPKVPQILHLDSHLPRWGGAGRRKPSASVLTLRPSILLREPHLCLLVHNCCSLPIKLQAGVKDPDRVNPTGPGGRGPCPLGAASLNCHRLAKYEPGWKSQTVLSASEETSSPGRLGTHTSKVSVNYLSKK